MEVVNKSIDIDKRFDEIEKSLKMFEKYKPLNSEVIFEEKKVFIALSIEIVNGLNNIFKNGSDIPDSKIVDRVCEFIDKINCENNRIWDFASQEKDGEILISFLKELAVKGCIPQINKIFWSGESNCPLVNILSSEYKTENSFYELFNMLPEDYQKDLLGETIYYSEGDIDFSVSLIGGVTEISG